MKTTRGQVALRQEGFTTKGNSQVTEEAGRGEAIGETGGRRLERPIAEALDTTPMSSVEVDEAFRASPITSTEADGFN